MLIDDSMMSGGSKEGGGVPPPPGSKEHTFGVKKTFSLKNRFFCSGCREKVFQSETVMAVRHDTFFSLGSSLHIMHTFLSHTFLSHSIVILIIPFSLFSLSFCSLLVYMFSVCVFFGERSLASIPLVVLAPSSKYILFLTETTIF